jgi:fatty acid desaturase
MPLTLRFVYYPLLQVLTLAVFAIGGPLVWIAPLTILLLTIALDELLGDVSEVGDDDHSAFGYVIMYVSVALTWLIVGWFLFLLARTFGQYSPLTAIWPELAKHAGDGETLINLLGVAIAVGMHFAAVAGNIGHEHIHRANRPVDVEIGRWLFCLPLHTSFPIEHMHGHHTNAGLYDDPATARRGESFWQFLWRTTTQTYIRSWHQEADRLARRGKRVLTIENQAVAGYIRLLAIVALFFLVGGWMAVFWYMVAALIGLMIFEQFNYISHYGLVRAPRTEMSGRHAWTSLRLGSSSFGFNLCRHASHHVHPSAPYWALRKELDSPMYPYGPFAMATIALLPTLWHRVVASEIENWDRHVASDAERGLLAGQSAVGL